MKKLLSLLAAFGITATTSATVVACVKQVDYNFRDFSDISRVWKDRVRNFEVPKSIMGVKSELEENTKEDKNVTNLNNYLKLFVKSLFTNKNNLIENSDFDNYEVKYYKNTGSNNITANIADYFNTQQNDKKNNYKLFFTLNKGKEETDLLEFKISDALFADELSSDNMKEIYGKDSEYTELYISGLNYSNMEKPKGKIEELVFGSIANEIVKQNEMDKHYISKTVNEDNNIKTINIVQIMAKRLLENNQENLSELFKHDSKPGMVKGWIELDLDEKRKDTPETGNDKPIDKVILYIN